MLPVAEDAENMPEIEMQWAVLAMNHAEAYWGLLQQRPGRDIRLTKVDDEIYKEFREIFPDLNVEFLQEDSDFKSPEMKAKWREFINRYEKKVKDFAFGSLLRINTHEGYEEKNSMFEIARNREGFNNEFSSKN
ncbi:Protein PBDC1 [Smittium mucronatum]|uniref:Protein PBDC1 n=1 Tax=Smittium mucronatum TaxID=133383 RepID=A0A1R0H6A5_9FUNG|nr:Protein PBDC1 [Smittium mucronatum]